MTVNTCALHNRMELEVHCCLLAWSRDEEKYLGREEKSLFVRTLKGAFRNNVLWGPTRDTLISERKSEKFFPRLAFSILLSRVNPPFRGKENLFS